jgi:hypothetical protein
MIMPEDCLVTGALGGSMAEETGEVGRVSFIAGQVHALRAFAAAIAVLSRQDGRLAQEFEKASLAALIALEGTRADEKLFEGFQHTARDLRVALTGQQEA